ncbi:MAG: adenylosuccinate lyase [Firmicutes bacterium ML8_F2]|jgi:adenylosuccinate lyase|nr:MAG: adenylosuccinate lyase [Firmicutes bacterium ML8_F2]
MIERYTHPEMGRIWSLENRYQKFLTVELCALEAWSELGVIPSDTVNLIAEKASFSVERIEELEKETRHDVVAFTRCVAESLGEESRFFHYGLTSYDVVDTALSVLLSEAASLLQKELAALEEVLTKQAKRYRDIPAVGRTHGVHAEPTSMGLKFALWLAETRRNRGRLERAAEGVRVGKMSGAVGNFAHIDPFIEEYVCRKMGLEPAPVSTQVLQRDRHAEFVSVLALIGATLEKMALELRNLQRTETAEMEEPFYSGQKGSSAMPHKRNPVTCEKICGLSRLLRGYATAALENVALWHERDISHSSVERVILPDATIVTDHLLRQMIRVMRELKVRPENIVRNLELTGGLIYSQRVLLELVETGLSREEAYDLVQSRAMEAWNCGRSFRDLLADDEVIRERLGEEKLAACFDPAYYLRRVDHIYRRLGI